MMPDIDMSHLSAEERKQIQVVLDRQRQEEEKQAVLIRALQEDLEKVQQTVKQVNEANKTQQVTTPGAPVQNGAVCQICHKTKFADGVGHSCNYCQLKSCARCGGRVTLRSNKVLWVCKLCRKKQEFLTKTGMWFPRAANEKDPNAGAITPTAGMLCHRECHSPVVLRKQSQFDSTTAIRAPRTNTTTCRGTCPKRPSTKC
ncbi:regulating synaptic membrane exocytosis protein 2-like isoform X2 [Amphiura filiformis]|uniref:regulating synaptic membrane exocytosis protein 2-like isoform X2 n=1 Tax=Amphiura filiformis TaxID=82378 RepID=UPI003B225530